MSITFKCKMCGGDLDITEGSTTCECEYCGTIQTVPSADNEKKINLFNRANRLRFASEFDKAAGVYENIVSEFPEEAEAYWGLCLCKYGIEYVDDPATGKKIPTCHRTSFENIFEDSNFEMALEYADLAAQRVYREEAKEIDRLQKSILDIAKNESPYDIFICYKETDEDGQRTKDSVMAQDIYDALTAKGYKVFFARITLEDKLGQEYEPYIFSALTSAKVMLAIGTNYEYFNAVWVKNEWSRFLDMMKSDKSKTLIPCFADIDAYDMPQEFKNLQGQDMSKIGFMQDLIRGIGKLINHSSANKDGTIVDSLAMRAEDYLLIENWELAEKYSERVLNIDSQYAKGYLYKLMAHFHIASLNDIDNCTNEINSTFEYCKLMEYADEHLKNNLCKHFENAEISHKKYLYDYYKKLAASDDQEEISQAINGFSSLGILDADTQCIECKKKLRNIKKIQLQMTLNDTNRQLSKEKIYFYEPIVSFGIVVFMWLLLFIQVKTNFWLDINVYLGLLFALIYFFCTVRSVSRLTGWKMWGSIFANFLSFGLIGSFCTVINFFKAFFKQRKTVKEIANEIENIKNQIDQLDQELNDYS